jgi:starch synthase
VVGFAKTGGLADVAGSLPAALARRGLSCAVVLPLYRCARAAAVPPEPTKWIVRAPIGPRTVEARLWRSRLPDADVPVWLIDQPGYFDRDDPALGKGLYQQTVDGQLRDYPDNCERFVFFSRAVLETLRVLDYWPDVLHLNDWQTGLTPVFLHEDHARLRDPALRERYRRLRTLFTIHNIAYQGVFWHWDMLLTGLSWRLFNPEQLEFYGHLNCLKAGMVFSNWISTVSPTYAKEIQTPYFGCGLQGVLAERRDRLTGIVNGVDYDVWDPGSDRHLAAPYSANAVQPGKGRCKADLQKRLGLAAAPQAPLLGVVARLAEQKGIDLILAAAPALLEQGAQLAVLGDGDPRYQQALRGLKERFPGQVGLLLGFNEALAHQIEAGTDLFLMPSLYEPSGLNQLYSMRYGTPPVVRATGGLADTVTDATPEAIAAGRGTGFRFAAYSADAFLEATQRGIALYRDRPEDFLRVMQAGMCQDWSWDRSAAEYEALYRRIAPDADRKG